MRNKIKKSLLFSTVVGILLFQFSVCNSIKAYADTQNKIVQKQNKVKQKKQSLSKQKLGIGAGIVLVVLIIGRAITPKEAFK